MAIENLDNINSNARRTGNIFSHELTAGECLGTYIVQNGAADEFLAQNPQNRDGGVRALLLFSAANPDRIDYVMSGRSGRFGFEDILGGGDHDFNDLVVDFRFMP